MGFSHAVYLAQDAHLNIINKYKIMDKCDYISHHNDFVIDRPRYCVYIDDLVMVGMNADVLSRIQSQYVEVMTLVGLPPKPSKISPPSSQGVECLGYVIHGKRGDVGVSVHKLENLITLTNDLIKQHHHISGNDLSKVIGRWTWSMLIIAIFSSVYRLSLMKSTVVAAYRCYRCI
jgi:hypothetical protein